ncbi:hypothetical protein BC829DRAFT_288503 [Chytridium lagenaria]|nr:hypothetical protein BC829DRAFT_288503 [Chytridium lagenaria]
MDNIATLSSTIARLRNSLTGSVQTTSVKIFKGLSASSLLSASKVAMMQEQKVLQNTENNYMEDVADGGEGSSTHQTSNTSPNMMDHTACSSQTTLTDIPTADGDAASVFGNGKSQDVSGASKISNFDISNHVETNVSTRTSVATTTHTTTTPLRTPFLYPVSTADLLYSAEIHRRKYGREAPNNPIVFITAPPEEPEELLEDLIWNAVRTFMEGGVSGFVDWGVRAVLGRGREEDIGGSAQCR